MSKSPLWLVSMKLVLWLMVGALLTAFPTLAGALLAGWVLFMLFCLCAIVLGSLMR